MATKKAKKKDEKLTIKRRLPVELNPDEHRRRSFELTEVINEIKDLEKAKASFNTDIKNKIGGATARQEELVEIVASGKEDRDVDVEVVRDFKHKAVRYIRLDTGELIEERAMSNDELQMELEDAEK